jgi:hypothetical protein
MVPLFLSGDKIDVALSGSSTERSTSRALFSSSGWLNQFSIGYFLEIVRVAFYVVLGLMGLVWVFNTFFWFSKLDQTEPAETQRNSKKIPTKLPFAAMKFQQQKNKMVPFTTIPKLGVVGIPTSPELQPSK